MKTSQRYLSSVNKGNVEVLDLPAGDVDHLLAKFFSSGQILHGWKEFSGACLTWHKFPPKSYLFFSRILVFSWIYEGPTIVIGNNTDHYDLLNTLNTLKMEASLKAKQSARRSIFASVMAVSPRFLYFWKIPHYTFKRDSVKGCFWSGKHLLCKVYCLIFWIRQWPGKRIGVTVSL